MGVYVRNGTPIDGPSLCETCTNARIVRGYRLGEEAMFCTAGDPDRSVPFRVRECNSYIDKNRQNLYEMEKIAMTITPRDRKRTGFVPSDEPATIGSEIELKLNESE